MHNICIHFMCCMGKYGILATSNDKITFNGTSFTIEFNHGNSPLLYLKKQANINKKNKSVNKRALKKLKSVLSMELPNTL